MLMILQMGCTLTFEKTTALEVLGGKSRIDFSVLIWMAVYKLSLVFGAEPQIADIYTR